MNRNILSASAMIARSGCDGCHRIAKLRRAALTRAAHGGRGAIASSPRPKPISQQEALYANRAAWVQATYINTDTNWLVAKADAEVDRDERALCQGGGTLRSRESRRCHAAQALSAQAGARRCQHRRSPAHRRNSPTSGAPRQRLFDGQVRLQRQDADARRHGGNPSHVARSRTRRAHCGKVGAPSRRRR